MLNLLQSVLGPHDTQKDEYLFHCPFCGSAKRKFSINIDKTAWKCWICNSGGRSFFSLFKQLNCTKEQFNELRELSGNLAVSYSNQETPIVNIALPHEYRSLFEPSTSFEYNNAKSYLSRRNITDREILRYQIGYCETGLYAERIIIPSYDASGKLNYFMARSYYDAPLKYKNPPISRNVIGFELQTNFKLPIILCEGVFDAMAIKFNAIPLFGKIPSQKLYEKLIYDNVQEIYLSLDRDALKETLKLAQKLLTMNKTLYLVQLNGKDPSELGYNTMKQLISSAIKLDFASILKLQLNL